MKTQLIRLTLHDGDPEGLRSAAIVGRTSLLIACPWTQFAALKTRDEAQRPAVYFLVGPSSPDAENTPFEQSIYIGECDSLSERFSGKHHKADSAEWSQIFLATTLEDTFNKAHARLAEHLLVIAAKEAKRASVQNGGTTHGKLSDGDMAFGYDFASNIQVLAQTLGLSLFRPPVTPIQKPNVENKALVSQDRKIEIFDFVYVRSIAAKMILDGSEFIVAAGSFARSTDMDGLPHKSRLRRAAARQAGVLVPCDQPGLEQFVANFPTTSTSAAGELVYGSSCAGPQAWRHSMTGLLYKDWLLKQTETTVE